MLTLYLILQNYELRCNSIPLPKAKNTKAIGLMKDE